MSALSEWDSFYVITGSAAGALIGLQFVVMTLMAERPTPGVAEAGRAFATPTVVHFSTSLLVAALVRVPWPEPVFAVWAAHVVGLGGLLYMALLVRRMHRQRAYRMDWEDRTFHVFLPFLAYFLLLGSGLLGFAHLELPLFGVGAGALLLLFIGIHNSWDAVAYQVYVLRNKSRES